MKDFWAFRTMVTPVIIQIIFWIGIAVCLAVGLGFIGSAVTLGYKTNLYKGLAVLLLGPLGVRVYCEILIIFFRINETLTEIKHVLEGRAPGGEA
jgi:hypothetical protein